MTQPAAKGVTGIKGGWAIVVLVITVLAVGAAVYGAAQKLRHDDCTSTMSTMPDGSQVTITTCS